MMYRNVWMVQWLTIWPHHGTLARSPVSEHEKIRSDKVAGAGSPVSQHQKITESLRSVPTREIFVMLL